MPPHRTEETIIRQTLDAAYGDEMVAALQRGHFTYERLTRGLAARVRPDLSLEQFLDRVVHHCNQGRTEGEAVALIAVEHDRQVEARTVWWTEARRVIALILRTQFGNHDLHCSVCDEQFLAAEHENTIGEWMAHTASLHPEEG